jgi:hypothetical protein
MSEKQKSKYMTPFIIGASDLAFILLFFFIMIGSGIQKIEKIEMPFKTPDQNTQLQKSPFRIEIYAEQNGSDSSRMAIIFNKESADTLYLMVSRRDLASTDAFLSIKNNISGFVQSKNVPLDSTMIDLYSSSYSYYGLIAITLAACNQLDYPCNLVYRTEES